jgi:hypothetical protein
MPYFKVAHMREQGVDLLIIPLDSTLGNKMPEDQRAAIADLQMRAHAAGLAGTVVPVWDSGGGRMAFIAPDSWHAFFKALNLLWVFANINRELYW